MVSKLSLKAVILMDRQKRARKSTKNLEDFYYPPQKRRKTKSNSVTALENRVQKSNEHSTNSTPNQPVSQNQSLVPTKEVVVKAQNPKNLKEKNPRESARRTKTIETQTLPTKKNLREILNELYTNPDYPSAFGGQLKQFILSKDSYSKHRQKRKIFKRRKIFVTGPYVGVQADTINYRNYARYNSGFRYILGNF